MKVAGKLWIKLAQNQQQRRLNEEAYTQPWIGTCRLLMVSFFFCACIMEIESYKEEMCFLSYYSRV